MRPTLWPRRVPKLRKMSSGLCWDMLAWFWSRLWAMSRMSGNAGDGQRRTGHAHRDGFRILDRRELEAGCGAVGKVAEHEGVWSRSGGERRWQGGGRAARGAAGRTRHFAVLVDDDDVGEVAAGSQIQHLLDSVAAAF